MSRLKELYETMESLKRLGLSVNEELRKEADQLEEELIKNEVLPIITETVAPALTEVKRELQIVLDYKPGQALDVHLYRNGQCTDVVEKKMEDISAPVETPESPVTPEIKQDRSRVTPLKITFLDSNEVILERSALDSLLTFINRIGVEKVRALGLENRHVPLVSESKDERYGRAQKYMGNGYYLMGVSSTDEKIRFIKKIAKRLGINVKAEKLK